MRRRTTLGDRNLVGENIIRIRAEKKMSQGELLSQIQLMGIDMNQRRLQKKIQIFFSSCRIFWYCWALLNSERWEIDVDATSMALCHTKVERIRRRISEGELTAQQIHDILISEIENELNRPTKEVNMAYVKICEELLSSLGADDEPLVDQY